MVIPPVTDCVAPPDRYGWAALVAKLGQLGRAHVAFLPVAWLGLPGREAKAMCQFWPNAVDLIFLFFKFIF
jgi:hypothetical protein